MPSRAEIRGSFESVLRAVSFVLLAWMLWLSLDRGRAENIVTAHSANLDAALRDWSRAGLAPDRIAVELDSTATPAQRDWLAALARAGSRVTWSGDLTPVGVVAQQVAAPGGGMNVVAAAGGGESVHLFDQVGALDTAQSRNGGVAFSVPSATGFIAARAGVSTATATLPDSVRLGRVLVLGSAGWESKFVVAALEEAGWMVDASMYVAPGVSVTQGSTAVLDTARYSAVIALDGASGARASEIERYVASGGGLILAGTAASLDAFASVRAASPGRMEAPAALSSDAPTTLRSLAAIPAAGLRADAVPLDRRGTVTLTAARRHVAGRVLQQGYLETWRWRMSGGDESMNEHRQWWTRAVASVAYAPVIARPSAASTGAPFDNAPTSRLVASLGSASPKPGPSLASAASAISLWWLAAALAFCLLAEWSSRRLRGVR